MTTENRLKLEFEAHERAAAAIADKTGRKPSDVVVSDRDFLKELTRKTHPNGTVSYLSEQQLQQEEIKRRQEEEALRDALIAQNEGSVWIDGVRYGISSGGFIKTTEVDLSKTGGFALVDIEALRAKGGDHARLVAEYEKPLSGSYRDQFAQFGLRFSSGDSMFHEVGYNGGPITELSRCNGLAWCAAYNQMEDGRVLGGQGLNLKEFRAVIGIKSFGEEHHAYHPNGSGGCPKAGDLIIMNGHIARCVGVEGGNIKLVSGNHGDKVTAYTLPLNSYRIQGWVSMDEVLQEKARRGNAVIGSDGQPILTLDQVPAGEHRVPQKWMAEVFDPANAEKVKAAREYAKQLAGDKTKLEAALAKPESIHVNLDAIPAVPSDKPLKKASLEDGAATSDALLKTAALQSGVGAKLAGTGTQVASISEGSANPELLAHIAAMKRPANVAAGVII